MKIAYGIFAFANAILAIVWAVRYISDKSGLAEFIGCVAMFGIMSHLAWGNHPEQ